MNIKAKEKTGWWKGSKVGEEERRELLWGGVCIKKKTYDWES